MTTAPGSHLDTFANAPFFSGGFFDTDLPPLLWFPDYLSSEAADALLTVCTASLAWEARHANFGGRRVAVPRLVAWYGEEDYRYGGFTHAAAAFPVFLRTLANELHGFIVHRLAHAPRFNSVLLNLYRDGRDSMSFHADNEVQLGQQPVIASLSVGATRTFQFRHKQARRRLAGRLTHGSLLVMHGDCQNEWEHGIPKESCDGPRLNLTFRHTSPLRAGPLRRTGGKTSR